MALGQRDTSFHHRNSQGTIQGTSVASVSLGTIYDVQWTGEVNYAVPIMGITKAEKDKPSDKDCQMQGLEFSIWVDTFDAALQLQNIVFSCHQKPTEHSLATSNTSSSSGP
jgi:hypothetical protein